MTPPGGIETVVHHHVAEDVPETVRRVSHERRGPHGQPDVAFGCRESGIESGSEVDR